MIKSIVTLISFCLVASVTAQTTADFENINIPDEFLNGSDGSGGFASGHVFLPNDYDPMFEAWTGWSISSVTDNTTPGFTNQYSAITGEGYNGSSNYAVAYAFDPVTIHLEGAAAGGTVEGLYVTNSTYAYLAMLNGDSFTKKFGGATGDDPDYFLLTIKKYQNGALVEDDSVDFYLADYRFADNNQDYFVNEWTYIDLSTLGDADSLQFRLTSTDTGAFGMNNPAYFCVDHITTADVTSTRARQIPAAVTVFPNPATEWVAVQTGKQISGELIIFNAQGAVFERRAYAGVGQSLHTGDWPAGQYYLQLRTADGSTPVTPFVIH